MKPSLPFANWVPVQQQRSATGHLCEWLYLGEKKFTEPFFDDTILACRRTYRDQRRYKVVSDLNIMQQWAEGLPVLPVTGIIFHVSRCGSTLLSQLLAADEKNSVLSEVPFLDAMLRLPYQQRDISTHEAEGYFQAAIRFYSQPRAAGQERLFIKADSWHLHFYTPLRRLFPAVPFFLLYREPMGVIRSQQRQRGIQSVPGMIEPEVLQLTQEQGRDFNLDRYMAAVLEGFYQQMIRILRTDPLAFPLHYGDGMENNIRQLYQRLHLPINSRLATVFTERCRFDAKRPQQAFAKEKNEEEMPAFLIPASDLYQQLVSFSASAH
ncbi:sulfotransferase family protein [Flavisolibacter sp. BT320]|nr:sulfotransferase family protein [Flavisolibacter longurius]